MAERVTNQPDHSQALAVPGVLDMQKGPDGSYSYRDTEDRRTPQKGLGVRMFSYRVFLATLGLGGTATAVAVANELLPNPHPHTAEAAVCTVSKFAVIGEGYVDNPEISNRDGRIDTVDPKMGPYQFGEAVINQLADPKDLKSPRTEVARASMVVFKGDHAEVIFNSLPATANTKGANGQPAAELRISFANDPIKDAFDPSLPPETTAVVRCGQSGFAVGGRYAPEKDIIRTAETTTEVETIGANVEQRLREIFGSAPNLTPKGDNPKHNAEVFKTKKDEIVQHARGVRATEIADAKKANPALESNPTSKPSTAPATPTVVSKPASTPTRGAEAATPTPGSGQSGTTNPEGLPAQVVAAATNIAIDNANKDKLIAAQQGQIGDLQNQNDTLREGLATVEAVVYARATSAADSTATTKVASTAGEWEKTTAVYGSLGLLAIGALGALGTAARRRFRLWKNSRRHP